MRPERVRFNIPGWISVAFGMGKRLSHLVSPTKARHSCNKMAIVLTSIWSHRCSFLSLDYLPPLFQSNLAKEMSHRDASELVAVAVVGGRGGLRGRRTQADALLVPASRGFVAVQRWESARTASLPAKHLKPPRACSLDEVKLDCRCWIRCQDESKGREAASRASLDGGRAAGEDAGSYR